MLCIHLMYDTSLNMRLLPLICNKSIATALFKERIFEKSILQFFYSFHHIQDWTILPHPHSVDKWGREEWTLSFVSIEVKVCETRYVDRDYYLQYIETPYTEFDLWKQTKNGIKLTSHLWLIAIDHISLKSIFGASSSNMTMHYSIAVLSWQ